MKSKKKQKRSVNKKPAFLKAFRALCSVTEAAAHVGIDRSLHYQWMAEPDGEYRLAFEAGIPEAAGLLEDDMVRLAHRGHFEPNTYQGKFQYANRKRTLCTLQDGTSAFEDEIQKGAKVVARRTVVTADGEMLGVYRKSEAVLARLLAAWLPAKYGQKTVVAVTAEIEVTDPDDAKRELIRLVAGITIS